MTPKSQSLALLLLLSHVSVALGGNEAAAPAKPLLGGWQPIEDVTAPEVVEAARFAVAKHNEQANSMLKYASVVRGEQQAVAGTNYRLIIAAKDGGVAGQYEAVVYVRPWEHYKRLTSFQKV